MPVEREIRVFIQWSLHILATLIKKLPREDANGSIYDPGGVIRNHKQFSENNWKVIRTCDFEEVQGGVLCSIIISQGVFTMEIDNALRLGRPVAILTAEEDFDGLVGSIKANNYLQDDEPDVVHIHSDKAADKICWLLIGFNTPSRVMIAMSPHHFVTGVVDNILLDNLGKRSGTDPKPPIFTVENSEGSRKNIQCAKDIFQVKIMAEFVSDCLQRQKQIDLEEIRETGVGDPSPGANGQNKSGSEELAPEALTLGKSKNFEVLNTQDTVP